MAKVVKRTFSLTEEQARFIDERVEQGGYASGSEVVREGLRNMARREAAIDRWLREEVLPTIDAYKKDPSQLLPADKAFSELDKFIEEYETPKARRRTKRAA